MITLKNVKLHADMSEETDCFSASIYVGGKLAGTVKNNGRSGCNRYYWQDRAIGQQVEEWAKQQPTQLEFEKLDQIIDKLLARIEVGKQLARWAKKGVHFRLKGDRPGWRRMTFKGGKLAPYDAASKAWLEKTYGDKLEIVLNEDLEKAIDAVVDLVEG